MHVWLVILVMALIYVSGFHALSTPLPPRTYQTSTVSVETEWAEFHTLAYQEYEDEFTSLFNGYETKWSKNGRLMLRTGDSGPYKFVRKAQSA